MHEQRDSTQLPRYRAAWRWHFFAGVFVVPFLLVLAVTGLVMIYYLTVESPAGERLSVSPGAGSPTSPTRQMAAASDALPGSTVALYIPPRDASSTAQFELLQAGSPQVVDVDPYTSEVLRIVAKDHSVYAWAQRIHSSLLLGDAGDTLLEIVAGLTLLLLATGTYMWMQQRGKPTAPAPSSRRRGWRRWHLLTGLWAALGLCFFLVSGLAWTNLWGGKFVQPWGSFPAEKWGPVSLGGSNHGSMNHGAAREVPWGLEQTPMPISGKHPGQQTITLDTVDQLARTLGFGPRYRINLPLDAAGVYTISSTSMTGDIDLPGQERTVHVDRHSGEILAQAGFEDYSPLAKSMAVGIAVHQGTMGAWNIALNALACLALIFLCVSGTVLWWLRRPAQNRWLPAPPRIAGLPLRSGLTALLLLLGLALPLLGVTLVGGLLLYLLGRRYRSA